MSETNGERSTREPASKRAITRDRYDAILLDLDGVITDTASVHAACWKQMFDEYLQKRATREAKRFARLISRLTTGLMWTASPASTAFATSSNHVVSNCPREAPRTPLRSKQ